MKVGWPLAAVVIALVFFAYCAYSTREATQSVEHAVDDFSTGYACYLAGYKAAMGGETLRPATDDEDCVNWFELGALDAKIHRSPQY